MGFEKLILILTCISGTLTFTCPDDSHSFYHADVSTNCTVYHFCENSQLTTLTCQAGKAFNHATSQCEDNSSFNCIETMDHHNMHHHQKRSIQEFHVIPVKHVQTKAVELYHAMKPLIVSAVQDSAPSIYAEFEANYLPTIITVKKDVMPLFYEKALPQIQKSVSYARRMVRRIIKKAYESYELSNSTHITVISFSDIINDFSNDIKPVIRLGKYMSARLIQNTRAKRSVEDYEIPDFLTSMIQPFVKNIFGSIENSFVGQENTVISKVIFPFLYKIMQDPETRFDLMKGFYTTKAAFLPVILKMLNLQTFDTPEGTSIRIPRVIVNYAMNRFNTETRPIIYKILNKHLATMLTLAAEHVPLIMKSVEMLNDAEHRHAGVLKDAIMNFIIKHGSLMQTSDSKYIHTYTLTEIKKDLRSIVILFLQLGAEYFDLNRDSWINMFFNQDSIIYKSLEGSRVHEAIVSSRSNRQ